MDKTKGEQNWRRRVTPRSEIKMRRAFSAFLLPAGAFLAGVFASQTPAFGAAFPAWQSSPTVYRSVEFDKGRTETRLYLENGKLVYSGPQGTFFSRVPGANCSSQKVKCVEFGAPLAVDIEAFAAERPYMINGVEYVPSCLEYKNRTGPCRAGIIRFFFPYLDATAKSTDWEAGFFYYDIGFGVRALVTGMRAPNESDHRPNFDADMYVFESGVQLLGPNWEEDQKRLKLPCVDINTGKERACQFQ